MIDGAWLGIDVGWIYPAADSDGRIYRWTHKNHMTWVPPSSPVTIKRANGQVLIRPAYTPQEAAQAFSKGMENPRIVRGLAMRIVTKAKETDRGIALEDWTNFQRRKAAWMRVWQAIANVAEDRGVPVTQVDRAYTSITCPLCGHKGRENRPSRDRFECVSCGHKGQSDIIAAINIAAKASDTFRIVAGSCANALCQGSVAWKAGLCVTCYGFKRRYGHEPNARDMEIRHEAPDVKSLRASMHKEKKWEREFRLAEMFRERIRESWSTHDAWGNPKVEKRA